MKNKIVSQAEWRKARLELLEKEKEFTRLRDELTAQRLAMPWEKVDKEYVFESVNGPMSLADLFGNASQLIIYHFMLGPDWGDTGCKSCSFWADNFNQIIVHLKQRDVNLLCISRGPLDKLQAFKKRMNWTFDWVSSEKNDFNFDYQVTSKIGDSSEYNYRIYSTDAAKEMPGISVFYKDEKGKIFHTYSCYARGLESFNTAYRYLDIVPKGRDEDNLSYGMEWLKHHDRYYEHI